MGKVIAWPNQLCGTGGTYNSHRIQVSNFTNRLKRSKFSAAFGGQFFSILNTRAYISECKINVDLISTELILYRMNAKNVLKSRNFIKICQIFSTFCLFSCFLHYLSHSSSLKSYTVFSDSVTTRGGGEVEREC